MKVLALTKYGSLGASTRMRTLQYVPYLRSKGWRVEIAPFLDDSYLCNLYARKPVLIDVLRAYARRLSRLLSLGRYDMVWIEKEALPWLPWWVERLFLWRARRVVVDYDDAMFHRYDQHRRWIVRAILGRKIDSVMASADTVVVGNSYLGDRATRAGASTVEWVPTVIDVERYPPVDPKPVGCPPVVGWIGSPGTAALLKPLFPVFSEVARRTGACFQAIGARPDQLKGSPFEAITWTASGEVMSLRAFDIGIMPLQDEPWQRGKCGYKLVQYMACGLPVVASPVGVNSALVESGVNGFLPGDPEQWAEALHVLLDSRERRLAMGARGREKVLGSYTLQMQAPRLASILERAARRAGCS